MKTPIFRNVFLSYSHRDIDLAKKLTDWLEERGHEVWIDAKGVLPGDNYLETIAAAVSRTNVIVPILSQYSVGSRWVVHEVSYALECGKPIIPVFKESVKIPPTLEFALAGIHRVDFSDTSGSPAPWSQLELVLSGRGGDPVSGALNSVAALTGAASRWISAGFDYAEIEAMAPGLLRWIEAPLRLGDLDDSRVSSMLLLGSIHRGSNWGYWVQVNSANRLALEALFSVFEARHDYVRPRLRTLYAFQYFDSEEVKLQLGKRTAELPKEISKIFAEYVLQSQVPAYLRKIKNSSDPDLARKGAAVLREISRNFDTEELEDTSRKLPFF